MKRKTFISSVILLCLFCLLFFILWKWAAGMNNQEETGSHNYQVQREPEEKDSFSNPGVREPAKEDAYHCQEPERVEYGDDWASLFIFGLPD